MPIYNEDAVEVFAGLRATIESVGKVGALDDFDFYVLSDSTKPECWEAEEAEWRQLRDIEGRRARIFYRRRPLNAGRKSGNIADFCENWGALYDYVVVLDADSLMTGDTLVRLARMMDANPRAGLIQAPPMLVSGTSLFARIQQFASSVYGPVYVAGLSYLQGAGGNYWGHNAIIRVKPFIEHCGLPKLPGRPPLGGEIMSHDFVEAALLRRAGWEVWLAPDLGGSYEAAPPTLLNYLKRDRRWCQGNLQHIKLIFAHGFRMSSRVHFAAGVMSYLSSPLWLLLLVLFFAVETFRIDHIAVSYVGRYPVLAWPVSHAVELLSLVLATATLIYGPKLLAFLTLLRDPAAVRAHGGIWRVALGVVFETLFSTLLAPILMLSHSWFVLSVLIGRGIGWGGQQRGACGIALGAATRAFAPHTLIAVFAGVAVWYLSPAIFWWYMPILSGLLLAIFLCRATSIPGWGIAAGRWGLFLIPSEAVGLAIVDRLYEIIGTRKSPDVAPPRFVPAADSSCPPAYSTERVH
jgi:membrane glycosyltransferase